LVERPYQKSLRHGGFLVRPVAIRHSHSCRRYPHIEAVFVFGDRLDHWSARAGHFGLPTFNNGNSMPHLIYRLVSASGALKWLAPALSN
jgi:hypothetical protein